MNRRQFLAMSAAPLAAMATAWPASGGNKVGHAFHVITDVGPSTSVRHLTPVLQAFLGRGLPVCCVVSPEAEGQRLAPDGDLARMLSSQIAKFAGLLELVAYLPDTALRSGYFQARAAYRARSALRNAVSLGRDTLAKRHFMQSIACRTYPVNAAPLGLRSAGFRNVLSIPDMTMPVGSETWPNGTMRIFGGRRADLHSPRTKSQFNAPLDIDYLSATTFESIAPDVIGVLAGEFADAAIDIERQGGTSFPVLSDLQLRDSFLFQRLVCIELLDPRPADAAEADACRAFLADMKRLAIPVIGRAQDPETGSGIGSGYWVTTGRAISAARDALSDVMPFRHDCTLGLGTAMTPGQDLGPGIGVILSSNLPGDHGIDDCGVLQIPVLEIRDAGQIPQSLDPVVGIKNDIVISVSPAALISLPYRNLLVRAIADLQQDSVTSFVSLAEFADHILPASPLISAQRRTAAALPAIRQPRGLLSDAARLAYLDDARTAWSYIERFTNPRTGLCPSTANFARGAGDETLETVTMWDVGSHINGLVAAAELGVITDTDSRQRIARILPNLHGRKSDGRLLPQEWIRTDQSKRGNRNFDGCDAGRLLASLSGLQARRGFDPSVAGLVASWNLGDIIRNGEINSVIDGELYSTFASHCAQYSAVAFRKWGFTVASPYEIPPQMSETDRQMALLEQAALDGPIGAEPLLLETIELGESREAAFLSDVLFAAQIDEFNQSGTLTAVSETALNRSPWFAYQGLKLDAPERTWAVTRVGDFETNLPEEEGRDILVLSSKAAFLWAACRPHDFSDRLVDHVRANARTQYGFSSGIYTMTQKPMSDYSDLNTNSIILQSISRILKQSDVGSFSD